MEVPDDETMQAWELSRTTAVSSAALHGPGDVGRRVAREAVTGPAAVTAGATATMSGTGSGGEFIAGWAIIGVIVAYFPPGSACEGPPAKKGKRDLSDGAFSTPLGEEDQGQLGLGATTGLWRVVFGDGSEQMMDEAAVHAAVFRFRSLISSAAAQIKSLVTPEMLDLKLIPPYFAQFSEAGDVDAAVMCPFCQGAVHEEAGENEDLSVVACAVCTKRAHASCCGVPPGPDGRILVWVCERCMEIQNRFYYCAKCLKELKSVTAYKYHRKINVCNKKMLVAVEKMNRMKERRPIVRRRQRVSKAGEPQEEASGQFSFIYEDDRTSSVVQEAREEAVGGAEAERAAIEEEKVASETFIPSKSFVDFAVMENYLEPLWHFHPNSAPYITISQWASAFLSSSFDQRDKSRLNSLWSLVLVDVGPSLPPNETESFDTLNAAARSRRVTDSLSSAPALRAFESCTLHSDDESVYLNTGGAVTSISFAPFQPLGRESNTSDKIQYFAVAMGSIGFHSERTPEPPGGRHHDYNSAQFGPGYLEPLVLGQCRRVDNILQLWSSKNIGSGRSDERFATLEYAVELRARGAVLQTAWSPFKCHGTARFDDVQASFPIKWRSYLGTLALVCGDGLCLVFMLPSKHHGNVLASTGWGAGPEAPVLPENSVCRFILGTGEAHDHILCADWSRSNPFQLFCGHRDGAISVWNLDSIAALRIKNPAIWLTDALTPRTSVIRAVRACPYNSDWVAAGGQDGKVRIWSVLHPSKPLFTIQHIYSNSILDLAWDSRGNGLISAYSGSSSVTFDPIWKSKTRAELYHHSSLRCGTWRVTQFSARSEAGKSSVIASGASDGTVCCISVPSSDTLSRPDKLRSVAKLFRIVRVDPQPAGNDASDRSAAIFVSSSEIILPASMSLKEEASRIYLPPVAITALDASDADPRDPGDHATIAYGGPSGLVRLHGFSIPRELDHSDERRPVAHNEAECLVHFAREVTRDATL